MVKSKLDPTIDYSEFKGLDKTDLDFQATVYDIELFAIDIEVAFGKPKYTYIDKNIVYIPLYLILDNKVALQLGVYEETSSNMPNILDEDQDIDIELLKDPLLYKSTTPSMIKKVIEKNEKRKADILKKAEEEAEEEAKKQAMMETNTQEDEDESDRNISEHFDFCLFGSCGNSEYSDETGKQFAYAYKREELKAKESNADILAQQNGKDDNPHKTKHIEANDKALGYSNYSRYNSDDDNNVGITREFDSQFYLDIIGTSHCRSRTIACTREEFAIF